MRHLWIECGLGGLGGLTGLIVTIDEYLSNIYKRSVEMIEDADSFGLFDSAEHATGLGLVACQTYMAMVYGNLEIEKRRALSFGPKHHGGLTKVQIVNHAANYWKHNNEWALDRRAARQEAIKQAFESIGFPVGTDYPLSGVLTELADPYPASLRAVISILEAWKVELYKAT
jgi:hypothetical protein